jgi:hypothetical protein
LEKIRQKYVIRRIYRQGIWLIISNQTEGALSFLRKQESTAAGSAAFGKTAFKNFLLVF